MQWARWFLIGVLILTGVRCARRDWVSDLLVLTDVTGTWEGSVSGVPGVRRPVTMVLQQTGPKVTGQLLGLQVEGVVSGEVVTFSVGVGAELTVDGDEMLGTAEYLYVAKGLLSCRPCFLRFRRVSSPVPSTTEPTAREKP